MCRSCKYRCARQVRDLTAGFACRLASSIQHARPLPLLPSPVPLPTPGPSSKQRHQLYSAAIAGAQQALSRPRLCLDSTLMKHSTQRQIENILGFVCVCAQRILLQASRQFIGTPQTASIFLSSFGLCPWGALGGLLPAR